MKQCIQEEKAKKNTYKLRKKLHVHMANQNNLHAKQKPSKRPHPPHFSNGASLSHKHHVHMTNPKNLRAKQKPSQHPQHPHPPHFSNGPSLSHCRNYPTNGLNQTDKASPFPTTETLWGMGTSFRRNGSWDRLGGQGLLTIGHGSQGNH